MGADMIKVDFVQIAEKAIIEKNTNKVSLINIVDTIHIVACPFALPDLTLALRSRNESKTERKVKLGIQIKQNEEVYIQHDFNVDYEDKTFNTLTLSMNGLLIKSVTPLQFTVLYDSQPLASIELNIVKLEPIKKT